MVAGVLHFKDRSLRQVVIDKDTKKKVMLACHDDDVGGCHFGRDKTVQKLQLDIIGKE